VKHLTRILGLGLAGWLAGVTVVVSAGPGTAIAAGADEAPKAASAKKAERKRAVPTWYAATVAEDQRGGFVMVHFWSRGALLRSEAVLAGRKIVTIVNRDTYYVVDAVGANGIAIERSEAAKQADDDRKRPFGNDLDQLLREGGEHIGTEQAGAQTVDVYRLTDDRGRRTIWVSQSNPPVPLRVETFDRETATTGKVDYVNWLQNPSIAESFFEPDSAWRIDRLGYEEYRKRIRLGPIGPAPVLYRHLLHGESTE
jgi:outer membrane lipoprotein-sorting protein